MLLDIATEELSHLEMIGQLCVQLLRGSPSAMMDEVEGSYLGDLGLPPERVVGTFFDRPNISASLDQRDVFGAQQQSTLERLSIPVFTCPPAMASPF